MEELDKGKNTEGRPQKVIKDEYLLLDNFAQGLSCQHEYFTHYSRHIQKTTKGL